MQIIGCIATLRPSALVALGVRRIRAVAPSNWEKISPTGRFGLGTVHAIILRTARWPTIRIAAIIRSVGAITIPRWTLVAHWLCRGTLYNNCAYLIAHHVEKKLRAVVRSSSSHREQNEKLCV